MTLNSYEVAEPGWDTQKIEYVMGVFEQVFRRRPSAFETECFRRVLARAASRGAGGRP